MKHLKILGIYRLPLFSNNAIEADRLILDESLAQLQRLAPEAEIQTIDESNISKILSPFDLVLTMSQSEQTLQILAKDFKDSVVWNSPQAIRNCYRKTMSKILSELNVGYVPYQILPTDGSITPKMEAGEHYWLKRSDFHALTNEDVTFAETSHEAGEKIRHFRERGVTEIIVQRHIHGDIYKFYGVKGKFFRAIRVRDNLSLGAPLEENTWAPMKASAEKAAAALGVSIFGGDCILDKEGNFHFIDLNDWPSFRICRNDAAAAIAALSWDYLRTLPHASSRSSARHV